MPKIIDSDIKVLIKSAGAPKSSFDTINNEEFMKQAREFRGYDVQLIRQNCKGCYHNVANSSLDCYESA